MALVSAIYPPEIWANESLMVLYDNLVMARLVHRDFEDEVKNAGDVVNTRKPTKGTVRSWSGICSNTEATTQGADATVECLDATSISINLDKNYYTSFIVEDRDAATSIKDLKEEFIIPFVQPIAQQVDDDIMTQFTAGTDYAGNGLTAVAFNGVSLNAAMDEDDVVQAREQLNTTQCPFEGRRMVLCTAHEADLLRSALFQQADQSGSTEALVNANLGRKFGFDIYMSQNVPTFADTYSCPLSLAFHRNVCALVMRPLPAVPAGLGVQSSTQYFDGVSIQVVSGYSMDHKGVEIAFNVLYGVQLLDANLGCLVVP